jgi:hypothetical protein
MLVVRTQVGRLAPSFDGGRSACSESSWVEQDAGPARTPEVVERPRTRSGARGVEGPCSMVPEGLPARPEPRPHRSGDIRRVRRPTSRWHRPLRPLLSREVLESLDLHGPWWTTTQTFDDGQALFTAVCEHGLEGVVAKKLTSRYGSGQRGWVETKNPDYWRRESEIEAIQRSRRRASRSRTPVHEGDGGPRSDRLLATFERALEPGDHGRRTTAGAI